jgi:MFS family permease
MCISGFIVLPVIRQVVALAGCLIGGIGNGLLNVQITTLLQKSTPPQMLGRMGGMFQSTAVAGQIAGIVITPLLIPAILSMSVYYAVSFVCMATLVVYLVLQLKGGKRTLEIQPE